MIEDVVKIPSQTLTIRIPNDVLAQVNALKDAETRSLNGQIVQLVKEALAARVKN